MIIPVLIAKPRFEILILDFVIQFVLLAAAITPTVQEKLIRLLFSSVSHASQEVDPVQVKKVIDELTQAKLSFTVKVIIAGLLVAVLAVAGYILKTARANEIIWKYFVHSSSALVLVAGFLMMLLILYSQTLKKKTQSFSVLAVR